MAGRTARIRCLRLVELAKHSVDRVECCVNHVEHCVDLLTDLLSRESKDK